jgi:hypothetical protein
MIDVTPILPSERIHCAYCAKPLQPQHSCRKTFWTGTVEASGKTPEEQLAAYNTNRRVVRVARTYSPVYDSDSNVIGRTVHRIEVVHFPEADEWGLWGKFCGQLCAARFGYAAHCAGYKFRRKS